MTNESTEKSSGLLKFPCLLSVESMASFLLPSIAGECECELVIQTPILSAPFIKHARIYLSSYDECNFVKCTHVLATSWLNRIKVYRLSEHVKKNLFIFLDLNFVPVESFGSF